MHLADMCDRDVAPLYRAMRAFEAKVLAQPDHYKFARGFNFSVAYGSLLDAITARRCLYIDGYMVFFDIITPWYGGEPLLQEWFTIKVANEDTQLTLVVAQLHAYARGRGCRAVLGGDSSPVSLMASAYEAEGFTPLTKQYFKEV